MSFAGKKVSKHVNSIMGPTSTNLSYNLASCSLMSSQAPIQIERKPKRKSKLTIVKEIHGMPKTCLSTAIFQKKLHGTYNPPKYSVAVTKMCAWLDYCH